MLFPHSQTTADKHHYGNFFCEGLMLENLWYLVITSLHAATIQLKQ